MCHNRRLSMIFTTISTHNSIFHFIFSIFHTYCHEQLNRRALDEKKVKIHTFSFLSLFFYLSLSQCNIPTIQTKIKKEKVIIIPTESPVNVMSCSQMLKSSVLVSKLSSKIKSPLQIFFSFTALIPLVVVTLFSHFVIAARTTTKELMVSTRRMKNFPSITFFITLC